MANKDDDTFRIRAGRLRNRGARAGPRPKTFLQQVRIAAQKAGGSSNGFATPRKGSGRFNARGRGAHIARTLPSGKTQGRFRPRRVVVKARVVKLARQRGARGPKMRGVASWAVDTHLRYLERDGVTRDGQKGHAYSAFEDRADGQAFVERGREDRHQFRFIVAPEDAVELDDLRRFTRELMQQMENDLGTQLDWIAVDHYNTGHPHSHILVRGVTDDGKVLNIAGDYIAHGVRHRASELVTLELGPQSELDISQKLIQEREADRLTRLDRVILLEQQERGMVDLRIDGSDSYMVRATRHHLIDRAKKLERLGLAVEIEPGRWQLADNTEQSLHDLGERTEIFGNIRHALIDNGILEECGISNSVTHSRAIMEPIIGRVLDKGLAGDGIDGRLYAVIDGVDGKVHYIEAADAGKLDEIGRGHIVSFNPIQPNLRPRPADQNISGAAEETGIYRPSIHKDNVRDIILARGHDPDAFITSHIRRLEALRRAGHVERIDDDHWKIPKDLAERGMAYDAEKMGKDYTVRTLSVHDLEHQVTSEGPTWLDRELTAYERTPLAQSGFGRDVRDARLLRARRLVETRRVALEIDGVILDSWTEVSITRDLAEISASFELTMRDAARSMQSWPYATPDFPFLPPIDWGGKAVLSIDDEPVLIGWVEDVNPTAGESPSLTISGRDVTGDLVDCSAAPTGPTEFTGLDLLEIAQRICKPFGITVTADVDVGEPFDKFTLDCGETAMSAIEKGARQRALLVVSDGIGGLVLTRSGQTRAPGDLFLPGNLISSSGKFSSRERYSDYYVKGQSGGGKGKKGSKAGLDGTAQPLGEGSSSSEAPRPDTSAAKSQVTILGHARDEEITRYRPIVAQTRTEASTVDAQTQAEWMARVAEGKGTRFEGEVRDWRINGGLWRPNELVMVDDAYQDINRDLLVSGICYSYGDKGERTQLRLVGPEAFDLLPEGERKKNRKRKGKKGEGGALDGTAQGLS